MQTDLDLLTGDAKIVEEAKQRFQTCQQWEALARERWLEDYKFANADSDNGYQWPGDMMAARIDGGKPSITINKTKQHCLQIVNDAKQNKPSIKIRPASDEASYKSAEVYEGIIRHIEYVSAAQDAYDIATEFQVEGGIGYWRIVNEYINDDDFDQELIIKPIMDTLSVFMDRDIKTKSGIDSKYAIIFKDVPKDEFLRENPEFKYSAPTAALDNQFDWIAEEYIRVAEYYRIKETKDKIIALPNGQVIRKSSLKGSDIYKDLPDDLPEREVTDKVVEWYKIAGDTIIDRLVGDKAWKGKYIPIIRVIGREVIVSGRLDRIGHTRALKDAQRMYNYNASASIEFGALQTKIPWIAPAQAIENNISDWANANNEDLAVLTYNHKDDEGDEMPAPTRVPPPVPSELYVQGMQISNQDMMYVSGQYEADFGERSNEISGKAINERQRKGETATYHFIDNLSISIRDTGKILIDAIPKYYDTKRIIKIMGEDGQEQTVTLDPKAAKALQHQENLKEAQMIFNPNVGKYDVEADVGPAYATRRQEAWNAMEQITSRNPELTNLIGDLLFLNGDFPGADKIAQRFKEHILPKVLGNDPQVQKLSQELQKAQGLLGKMMSELQEERIKYKGKEQMREIDVYKAITDRIDVLIKHLSANTISEKDKATMFHDLMVQEHASGLQQVEASAQHDMNMELQANEPAPAQNQA